MKTERTENQIKSWLIEKKNKISKALAKLTKIKKRPNLTQLPMKRRYNYGF